LGTTKGFTLESSSDDSSMRCGSVFLSSDYSMCIKHEAGDRGMFFINRSNNVFLSHEYNQIINSTLGSNGVTNEIGDLTIM
jgi:hypothetical protein